MSSGVWKLLKLMFLSFQYNKISFPTKRIMYVNNWLFSGLWSFFRVDLQLGEFSVHGSPRDGQRPQMVESQVTLDDKKVSEVSLVFETNPLDWQGWPKGGATNPASEGHLWCCKSTIFGNRVRWGDVGWGEVECGDVGCQRPVCHLRLIPLIVRLTRGECSGLDLWRSSMKLSLKCIHPGIKRGVMR